MHRRLTLLTSTVVTALLSQGALAAAFQLYEIGTPIIATAGVGQAVTQDASTAYFNPAGMIMLPHTEMMVGSQSLLPFNNFSRSPSTTIRGDNGGNAGALVAGMNLYGVYNYSPNLKFGVSFTAPYAGALNYSDGWSGRFFVQDVTFYTINLNPSLAIRVNDWLAIGAGAAVEYMNLFETVALPILNLVDGQVNIKADSYAGGFNLGAMFTPSRCTHLGLAYRSQIVHHLHGDTTFLRINATPRTKTKMVMPSNIIASLSQDVTPHFTLLGELGWANWSSMQNTILTVDRFTEVIPRNWKNTYRAGLGGQYKVNPCLLWQAGVSFDSSPTNRNDRRPDMPMDKQIRVGTGVIYAFNRQTQLGASYEYVNFGTASIYNASSNGVFAGSYARNYADVVQVSLNVSM